MNDEQTELRFLTLAEAAIILQVSKRTILRMIQKKEVPALKVEHLEVRYGDLVGGLMALIDVE